MTTPAATASAPDASTEHQQLWNLIVLQSEAVQARLREFHQQTEIYIQHTGASPLAEATPESAAHEMGTLTVRERTTPAHVAPLPLVSSAMQQIRSVLCQSDGSIRDSDAMAQFTKRIKDQAESADDKMQVIFILTASFSASEANGLQSAFEKDGGYGVLVEWFEQSCSQSDDLSRGLSRLVLQFFQRHKPTIPFSRKRVLNKLMELRSSATGRQVKSLLKETIEIYSS